MTELSLTCCVPGCVNRWACEFGFGQMCSEHDRMRHDGQKPAARPAAVPVPKHEPAPHWQDDEERPF